MTNEEELTQLREDVYKLEDQVNDLKIENSDLRHERDDFERDLENKVAKIGDLEEGLEALPDPCKDGFHYWQQYGLLGGVGECRYCTAIDNGSGINYAVLDLMAWPLPAPMRKVSG